MFSGHQEADEYGKIDTIHPVPLGYTHFHEGTA